MEMLTYVHDDVMGQHVSFVVSTREYLKSVEALPAPMISVARQLSVGCVLGA